MKTEFGAVEAAGSDRVPLKEKDPFADRKRTEGGFVLPPGLMRWNDFADTHPDADQTSDEMKRRLRWEPETQALYVKTNDPDQDREHAELRKRFAADTLQMTRELRAYLDEQHVDVLVNPRGSKGLSARQREFPKVKILLSPLFFSSSLTEEKKKDRMQAIPGVAECILHFGEDGAFQLARFHMNTGSRSFWTSMLLVEAIFGVQDRIAEAYQRRDFKRLAEIIGVVLVEALQFVQEMPRFRKS